MARHRKKIIDLTSAIILLALITLDAVLWRNIFISAASANAGASSARIYFLPVTQGESALLILPNSVTVLTDAGPDAGIVEDLEKVLPSGAAPYIDLTIISYPQAADYEGYEYVLQHYQVGAFLYNGRADAAYSSEWKQLMSVIAAKHIPLITVGAGDSIHYGSGGSVRSAGEAEIDILSPDAAFARSVDPTDTGIVQRIITPQFTALLAADIGTNVEGALLARTADTSGAAGAASGIGAALRADILKAPFPGLGTAAGDAFLRAVAPRVIVVEPGVKNTASVPTKAMLAHLASSTSAAIASPKAGQFLLYNK